MSLLNGFKKFFDKSFIAGLLLGASSITVLFTVINMNLLQNVDKPILQYEESVMLKVHEVGFFRGVMTGATLVPISRDTIAVKKTLNEAYKDSQQNVIDGTWVVNQYLKMGVEPTFYIPDSIGVELKIEE